MKFDRDLCSKLWYELNPGVRCAFGNVSLLGGASSILKTFRAGPVKKTPCFKNWDQPSQDQVMCWYSHLNDNRAPTAWLCNGYIIGQCGTLWSKGSANFTVATWHETTWRKRRDEDENFDKQWQILEISICTVGITNITKFSYHLLHWPTLAF